jgi:serine/threonine-protein kinase
MGQARPQAAPSVFGRYETLFRIASGGMAEVYAARVRGEAGFQKLVALKRMLPHLTDDDRFVTMFMDEGKLAANISSPNVVSTLDLGRADDGSLYLVMELVVGTTLSTLLRNAAKHGEAIPVDVAVELLAQAAQGLHDAHEARTPFGAPLRIVHRDVSPQNILVGADGRVRITDFGVARAILRRTKTSTGEFKGKLSYFSPEQCADRDLDRRSDIFSLGVVAWEALTMRRLFHAENPLAVLERVTRMEIPSAHLVRDEVPASVAAVVATALERDRDARFSTAAELAQALRAAAREHVGVADRHRVADLVERYGGETLERVQLQIKESLASKAEPEVFDDEDGDKTEISSGIVFRDEDGFPQPSTPRAPSTTASDPGSAPPAGEALFREDPRVSAVPAEPRGSRTPLIVATLVGLLGLGGGAAIALLAADGGSDEGAAGLAAEPAAREADEAEGPRAAAAPDPGSSADEAEAATEAPEAGATGASNADDGDDGDEAAAEADAPAAEPRARRRPRRRTRRRERRPSLPTSVERGASESPREPRPEPRTERRAEPREAPSRRRAREPAPQQETPQRRPGGLMGLDDFQNLGGGR